jgi:hypothetical protein
MVFLVPKYIQGSLISPYKLSMPPIMVQQPNKETNLSLCSRNPYKMMMKALWVVEIAPFTS